MRTIIGAAAALLALAVGASAFAQSAGNWAAGVRRPMEFKPIDTSNAMKPFNATKAFRTTPQTRTFDFNRLFPKLTLASWPPRQAKVNILETKNNPFQPNPPKGKNPFEMPKK